MTAIEFRSAHDPLTTSDLPDGTKVPENIGKRVQDNCFEEGMMILTTSCFDTIRFIPALVVTEEQMERAVGIFTRAVERVAREG
jgi:4-aminobutyrate aminotransferase